MSLFPKHITKDQVNRLPLERYEGKLAVISRSDKLADAVQRIRSEKAVGFDTETKPTFRKGQYHHVSLLQIAVPGMVYLFRLNYLGMAPELREIFEDPRITKVGIGIRDDLLEMQRLGHFEPQNILDLNDEVKHLGVKNAGVRNLSAIFLEFRISKSQQTSNWERDELTEKQLRYAATDAWVCLQIYNRLQDWGYLDE
ncbi:3'-5' exonuclease [Roseivirga sp. BDSF3-8]|uniref:3'-5' exonuclease n=1 Tax=Roseivirga sp. BDSF3-8 TaxID=3241598 RepID=UPI0035326CEE